MSGEALAWVGREETPGFLYSLTSSLSLSLSLWQIIYWDFLILALKLFFIVGEIIFIF